MKKSLLVATLLISAILFFIFSKPIKEIIVPAELVADNGTLVVKFDLTRGGAISWISLSGSERSLVNIADEGRYIQQSYYAGKSLDRKADGQSHNWSPWPWNPIQVGDAFRNRAKILDYKQSSGSLYVKCIPMQWDMNNKYAEAEMEQWTKLDGNMLVIKNRLTIHRTDSIYGDSIVNDQELPAVYPISALNNLVTYLGSQPFTNDTLSKPEVINLKSSYGAVTKMFRKTGWLLWMTMISEWRFIIRFAQDSWQECREFPERKLPMVPLRTLHL